MRTMFAVAAVLSLGATTVSLSDYGRAVSTYRRLAVLAEASSPSPGTRDTALAEANGPSAGTRDTALAEANGPSPGTRDTAVL